MQVQPALKQGFLQGCRKMKQLI
ncbi:hypothetical protein CLS_14630 [[Clostridium] cf. saccharolyticum K10]|nr:hypothetical protein CLS_14630 [[Clostridium] cf. saccharolyticum K10]